MKPHDLPEILRYEGEFGPEMVTFIPFVHWLKVNGGLKGRKVSTYTGMRSCYFFLDDAELIFRPEKRDFVEMSDRWWPGSCEHTQVKGPFMLFPDYRTRYRESEFRFDRPVLFILNKFQIEWDQGPVNYIGLSTLDHIFSTFSDRFQIVYSRPGINRSQSGYIEDNNELCSYPDRAVVAKFPGVLVLEDLAAGRDYNEVKLKILALTHHFITVQGGGANALALFGDSTLIILHRQGQEFSHTYRRGYFTYAAQPSPRLLVARDSMQLDRCLDLLEADPAIAPSSRTSHLGYHLMFALLKIKLGGQLLFDFQALHTLYQRVLRRLFRFLKPSGRNLAPTEANVDCLKT